MSLFLVHFSAFSKLGAGGTVQERLFLGPMVDQALAQEDGSGQVRWLLGDNLGTTRDVLAYDPGTNQSAVANHLKYGAFGGIVSQTNAAEEPDSTYTGRQRDPETGLYYYRARWYDGAVGRFLSEDPLGFAAGDTNLQRYVGNSPITATDPSGMSESPGSGGVGGFGGGLAPVSFPFAAVPGSPKKAKPTLSAAPVGTFSVYGETVTVREPAQQSVLGPTSWGYSVKYTPPPGFAIPRNSRLILVQALSAEGGASVARFDADRRTADHRLLPEYLGQGVPGVSIIDRPRNRRVLDPNAGTWWRITVSAVVQTADPTTNTYSDLILGSVSFRFFDKIGGAKLQVGPVGIGEMPAPRVAGSTLAAGIPDALWNDALVDWNESPLNPK